MFNVRSHVRGKFKSFDELEAISREKDDMRNRKEAKIGAALF